MIAAVAEWRWWDGYLRCEEERGGEGKIGSHDSLSPLVGFVTDITITNDVTFDFNSSKTEKEIIVITERTD